MFYYEKIAKNLLQPADAYLRPVEMAANLCGRYRGDGRRLDFFVLSDPLDIELEVLQ